MAILFVTFGLIVMPRVFDENSQVAQVRRITYSDIEPYLDARAVVLNGRIMLCEPNNFAHLGHDPIKEQIADRATSLYWEGGYRISSRLAPAHIPPEGDSPWGFFARDDVMPLMLPYFIQAKHETMDGRAAAKSR